jgi:hypothetical protein
MPITVRTCASTYPGTSAPKGAPASHHTPTVRHLVSALALLGVGLLGACASTPPPPTEQLAVSNAAVVSATGAGATELAPTELRTARDKLARANAAVVSDDNASALTLAQQAQVDARLAEAKSRAIKAQKAASELGEGNRVLREEMERNAK